MNHHNHKACLVLNVDYSPISIIDWRKAMILAFRYFYTQHCGIEIIEFYKDDYVIGATQPMKIPAVIKTTKYFKFNNQLVNFSRKNIFIRDNYTCQYCGCKPAVNQLTYDHVIPKSKWTNCLQPATCWTNIVTACYKCNSKKGNKTLKQANMILDTEPYIPKKTSKYLHITSQLVIIKNSIPDEWKLYIN